MTKLLRWARTEREAQELAADGWTVASQRTDTHHHHYSVLYEKVEAPDRKDARQGELLGRDGDG